MFNFADSKGFKNFMAKLYGWGAALVIVGALFKIQHWPGAGIMLTIGLGTEAVIFFFSAFEKPHADPDWSLVYPELAGMHDDEPKKDKKKIEKETSVSQKIDKMLEEAKIGPDLIESLGSGLKKLSESSAKMADLSDTVAATSDYASNVKAASASIGQLNNTYQQTKEVLTKDLSTVQEFATNIKGASESANSLSGAYKEVANVMKNDINAASEYVNSVKEATNSVNMLKNKYVESADSLSKSVQQIDFSSVDSKSYELQINKITKNLEALNSVYELQLANVSNQLNTSKDVTNGMDMFLNNLQQSVEASNQYQELVNNLNKNMSILNQVYGNMLAAMNVNK